MTCLLELAGRPGGHGARPHSLKVTTISTLMTEVAKGQSNLPQLAVQGKYRAATAQDIANVYSRNLHNRQLFVSKFAQKYSRGNKSAESRPEGPSGFSDDQHPGETPLCPEFQGLKPAEWPHVHSKKGEADMAEVPND